MSTSTSGAPSRRTLLAGAAALAAGAGAAAVAAPAQGAVAAQSPVAISSLALRLRLDLPPLRLSYPRAADLTLSYVSNDGLCGTRGPEESVRATVPAGAGRATLGGTVYELKQFHFHTPAEHTVDGFRHVVEQHFVHQAADGRLLVLGCFLRADLFGGPVDKVLGTLPAECGPTLTVRGVDVASLVPASPTVVRYDGSLTTAPYTEGVLWNVMTDVRTASAASIDRLRRLFPAGDSRETQPLNGRSLDLVLGALF